MSDKKISDLTSGTPVQDTDAVPIARSGANYRIPASDWVRSAGGTLTGPLYLPSGSVGTPSYSWSANSGVGLYLSGNSITVAVAGAARFAFGVSTGNDLCLRSDGDLRFSSTTAPSGSPDAFISRIAAGVIGAKSSSGTANWFQSTAGRFSLASPVTNATTAFTSGTLSGLTANLVSGRKYSFIAKLWFSDSTANEGVKIDFNGGGAGVTTFLAQGTIISDTGTVVTATNATSAALATVLNTATLPTTATHLYDISGFIQPSSSGTFIIRAAQNSHSTGTLTVNTGSWIMLEDTP